MSTAKEVLHHPRAWVYARGVSGSPALHERFDALRRSALREGYEIVGQSSDARQRFAVRYPGRAALLRAVRKGLVDDVFVTRLSQLSRAFTWESVSRRSTAGSGWLFAEHAVQQRQRQRIQA